MGHVRTLFPRMLRADRQLRCGEAAKAGQLTRNAGRSPGVQSGTEHRGVQSMKSLFAALAGTALLALAAPASAQMQRLQPMNPPPMQQTPFQQTALPSWMQDDGSSSDYPVHMPGDFGAADELNRLYGNGIPQGPAPTTMPPAYYGPRY